MSSVSIVDRAESHVRWSWKVFIRSVAKQIESAVASCRCRVTVVLKLKRILTSESVRFVGSSSISVAPTTGRL
jgi:hypothetical protein